MSPDDPLLADDPAMLAAAFHRVADQLDALTAKDEELARRDHVTRRLVWAVAVLAVAVAVAVFFAVTATSQADSEVARSTANHALATAAKAQAAVAQRQDTAAVAQICATFRQLAALKPPQAADPTDSSRLFLDKEHVVLVAIGTDLCNPQSRHS